VVSFTTSANLLRNEGLPLLERKAFYNLTRKAQGGMRLTPEEEVQAVLSTLEDHGFHAQVRYEHCLDSDGERVGVRVVKDIFFISPDQIRLGRRFVSAAMYETDATFNTNTLRMPLSSMIGIDNLGGSFPLAYCFITSESAASFDFVAHQLTKYVFYDCPEPVVIIGDFSKGLGAS
jgi:hypothetical protein